MIKLGVPSSGGEIAYQPGSCVVVGMTQEAHTLSRYSGLDRCKAIVNPVYMLS